MHEATNEFGKKDIGDAFFARAEAPGGMTSSFTALFAANVALVGGCRGAEIPYHRALQAGGEQDAGERWFRLC